MPSTWDSVVGAVRAFKAASVGGDHQRAHAIDDFRNRDPRFVLVHVDNHRRFAGAVQALARSGAQDSVVRPHQLGGR